MKFTSTFSVETGRRQMMARESSRDSLFATDDILNEDDNALCLASHYGCDEITVQKIRKVRFADRCSTIYRESVMDRDECFKNWYEEKDYNRFARQTAQHMHLIRAMEAMTKDPFFWTKNLRRIHKSFTNQSLCRQNDYASSKSTIFVLMSNRVVLDERFVGMEFRVVPSIAQDFMQRREILLNEVFYWQSLPMVDASKRLEFIRQACEKASRPSSMYAHYIAKVSARNVR